MKPGLIAGLMGLLLAAACVAPPLAAACEMSPSARPESVSAYYELAELCIAVPPTQVSFDAQGEAFMLERVNAVRIDAGLPPLAWRDELRLPARFHSLDQAWNGTFGHDGAAGRTVSQRISALDRSLIRSTASENVAMVSGPFDPAIVVDMLQNGLFNSDGHRANMLNPDVTHMAVGLVRIRDRIVATQVFVRREGSFATPVPARVSGQILSGLDFDLTGWQSAGTWLAEPGNDEAPPIPSGDVQGPGDFLLRVRGELRLENGYRFIYLPGPDIELVADDARLPTLRRSP